MHSYKCSVTCLITFITYLSSHLVCQFQLRLSGLRFLFRIPFFASFVPCSQFCVFCFAILSSSSFAISTISAPVSGRTAAAGTSTSTGHSRDTRANHPFPVTEPLLRECLYLDPHRLVVIRIIEIAAPSGMSGSAAFKILFWVSGRRGGGTGDAFVPLFVVALCLVPKLCLCGVPGRLNTKARLSNGLLPCESWLCLTFGQQLNQSNFDGHWSPFISSQSGLSMGANETLSIESLLQVGLF